MLQNAGSDIIECGWLKNNGHEIGTTYFHKPNVLLRYIRRKNDDTIYVVMIHLETSYEKSTIN